MSKKNRPNKTLLDICILTAGYVEGFGRCVDSVLAQTNLPPYRLHVFVNVPPGEYKSKYYEVLSRLPDTTHVVPTLAKQVGFPVAANVVIKAGNSPLVMFITDDVVLRPDAIDVLLRRMDDPTIGLCGLKLLYPENSTDKARPGGKVQHVGHCVNIHGGIEHAYVGWSPEHPKCNVSQDCFSVTGAAFMVRRQLFQKAGGFNPEYGQGTYEDVELCINIRRLQARVFVDTGAVGTHEVGATALLLNKPYALNSNRLLFEQRNKQFLRWDQWVWY